MVDFGLQPFCQALAFLLLLDFLAFQPLWSIWFSRRLKPWWLGAIAALASPWRGLNLLGTLVLWCTFRHYFIHQRWSRVRRGGGAPGFMTHWAMLHLCTIQLGAFVDGSGELARLALQVARIDLATIMICAGFYKYCVGYLHHDGMEYGRVNPFWGYHWRFFCQRKPDGFYPQLMNRLACLVEIVGGICMLIPGQLQVLGAASISLSFVYVSLFIRLGRLAWLMVLLPALFWPGFENSLPVNPALTLNPPEFVLQMFRGLGYGYLALLPLVKFTQYANLLKNWSWPKPLQTWLDRYANGVPIIMWRVFTPDVTNFYVRIRDQRGAYLVNEETYSLSHWSRPWFKLRMLHVCESIALTSVFTTLRYFPSRPELFEQKLLEYSRSLGDFPELTYEVVAIFKASECFEFCHVESARVDLRTGEVRRERVHEGYDFSQPSKFSPVREASHPGSYVRAGSIELPGSNGK